MPGLLLRCAEGFHLHHTSQAHCSKWCWLPEVPSAGWQGALASLGVGSFKVVMKGKLSPLLAEQCPAQPRVSAVHVQCHGVLLQCCWS